MKKKLITNKLYPADPSRWMIEPSTAVQNRVQPALTACCALHERTHVRLLVHIGKGTRQTSNARILRTATWETTLFRPQRASIH